MVPARIAFAVRRLAARPSDRILEIGCGTGVAANVIAASLTTGQLTAIDRSAHAIASARARLAPWIAAGTVVLGRTALADADFEPDAFDRALAVNVNVFWLEPRAELAVLAAAIRRNGTLCLVYEPPSPAAVERITTHGEAALREHGFDRVRLARESSGEDALVSISARNARR
ncbi:MAG TPA: class I SAM-dependent methyltransferase [Gemmatimonadaceae bacterium]|nr:class I SAM-dependent methyltransferase [Gemmatimonadaceae bacterium]